MGDYTDLLYARPSVLEGIARLMDFAGSLNEYNTSETPEEADRLAIASDWYAIGQDLRKILGDYEAALRRQGRIQ